MAESGPEKSGAIGLFEIGLGGIGTTAIIAVPVPPPPSVPTIVPEFINTDLSNNMLARLKSLLPGGWFGLTAPFRDAVLGGIADSLAWLSTLIDAARAQTRIASAGGWFLDLIGWDFFGARFIRKPMESDASWRTRIVQEILRERDTRKGITIALQELTGHTPVIYEPWNGEDVGGGYGVGGLGYGGGNTVAPASRYGIAGAYDLPQGGYGYVPSGETSAFPGAGFYGSLSLPFQIFITAYRPSTSVGVANVDGYGCFGGGYGVGSIVYADISQLQGVVTDADIYATVADTLAAGITGWVAIENPPSGFSSEFDSEFLLGA